MGFLRLFCSLVVNSSAAIVYEVPEKGAHIEDMLPYGRAVEIVEENGLWIKDGISQGWILRENLVEGKAPREDAFVFHRGAYVFPVADTEHGPFLYLPFETAVEILEELPQQHGRWLKIRLQDGREGYIQRSNLLFLRPLLTVSEMTAFSRNFLGLSYLWGGTTSLGYDCSGFVQMLYRQMGISLPRNSFEQREDPRFVDVEAGQEGDLIFFFNQKGKVVHVGLMLDADQFICAFTKEQTWVCINSLSDERWQNGYFYYGAQIRRFNNY